ncbi:MAG: hypothetical protein RRC34_13270 [Lentisphaeria bacterium]|nr:hypothetical protein [Lentisphaeria bacterium]
MKHLFFALLTCAASSTLHAGMTVLINAADAQKITAPMRLVKLNDTDTEKPAKPVAGAADETYLEIPQGAGKPPEAAGDASFSFTVDKKGTYYLWARVWWTDGCGNSIGVSIDDGKAFILGQDATYKQWHWVKVKGRLSQLNLDAGDHVLTLSNREDGVAIDQILLTRNTRYVPVGIEKNSP